MLCCLVGGNRVCGGTLLLSGFALMAGIAPSPALGETGRERLGSSHVLPAVARLVPAGNLPGTRRLNLAIGLPLRNQRTRHPAPAALRPRQPQLPPLPDPRAVHRAVWADGRGLSGAHGLREVQRPDGHRHASQSRGAGCGRRGHRHREGLPPDPARLPASARKRATSTRRMWSRRWTSACPFCTSAAWTTTPSRTRICSTARGRSGQRDPERRFRARTAPIGEATSARPTCPGTSLTGAGQSVGLLQFDGFYASDITTYESQAGLPNVPLTVVPVDGGVSTPGSGVSEVSLDIEMVISMAPGVSRIYVYEAPNPSPWVDLLSRMANDNLAKQLSCSWGGGSPDPTSEQIFKQMGAQGQSFFNATGDSDAFTGAIAFPSDSTNITQVGGDHADHRHRALPTVRDGLELGLYSGSYVGSSGGISTYYAIPSYQQGISMSANQGSTTMRNVPDVALTGDNVYVVYGNGSTDNGRRHQLRGAAVGGLHRPGQPAGRGRRAGPGRLSEPGPLHHRQGRRAIPPLPRHHHRQQLQQQQSLQVRGGGRLRPLHRLGHPQRHQPHQCPGRTARPRARSLSPTASPWSPKAAQRRRGPRGDGHRELRPEKHRHGEHHQPGRHLAGHGRHPLSQRPANLRRAQHQRRGGGASRSPLPRPEAAAAPTPPRCSCRTARRTWERSPSPSGWANPASSTVFSENFDGVTAPALPAGWATSASGAESTWVTSTSASDTAPNAAFSPDPASVGVNELDSPPIALPAGSAQLTFRQNYNLETDLRRRRAGDQDRRRRVDRHPGGGRQLCQRRL